MFGQGIRAAMLSNVTKILVAYILTSRTKIPISVMSGHRVDVVGRGPYTGALRGGGDPDVACRFEEMPMSQVSFA